MLKSKQGDQGQEVVESNFQIASPQAIVNNRQATLAQLVERLIRNQQVAGSIPAGGSIYSQ
jgi:hypothetical protein